jgi:hypothetical protein
MVRVGSQIPVCNPRWPAPLGREYVLRRPLRVISRIAQKIGANPTPEPLEVPRRASPRRSPKPLNVSSPAVSRQLWSRSPSKPPPSQPNRASQKSRGRGSRVESRGQEKVAGAEA